jgi:Protein of unknown function (DUF3159)
VLVIPLSAAAGLAAPEQARDSIDLPPGFSEVERRRHPSSLVMVLFALARRLLPYLVESTVIPTVLFYVVDAATDTRSALIAGLAWSYVAIVRRVVVGRRVPVLLLLAALGLTVRTALYVGTESAVIYFSQEIIHDFATAAFFAVSIVVGRPLVARFARDFCSLDPEVERRPVMNRLFERLTFLWVGVNLASAVSQLSLLLTVSTPVYVGTSTVAAWMITATGAALTIWAVSRVARAERLRAAIDPDGAVWIEAQPVTS